MNSPKEKGDTARILHMITQFFWETFVAMALGYFLGNWLDTILFESRTILLYVGIVLGIFAGLRNLIVRALSFTKGEEHEKTHKRD
jgi:F0F1-type ATP synthase assembly protein I